MSTADAQAQDPGAADPDARRLAAHVAGWAMAGFAVTAGLLLRHAVGTADALPPWWLLAVLTVGGVAGGIIHVNVSIRGVREATNLNELALVPMMVLLPPAAAVVAGLVSGLVTETVLTRGQWRKLVFNVGWRATGVGLGSWLHANLAGPDFAADATHLTAAATAAAVLILVNTVAMNGIMAILSGRPRWTVFLDDGVPSMLVDAGSGLGGLLVAVLIVEAPLAIPLVGLLPFLDVDRARARSSGYRQLAAARDRFERTVDGSSDGIVLLDRMGRVEIWNPRMAQLTGTPPDQARGATLKELHYDHLLTAPGPRMPLAGKVVEVRRSDPDPEERTERGIVLSVRDVSREAEIAHIHDDLISRISHEFRTPVATVSGFLDTLQARWEDLPDTRRRELVAAAGRGADRLGALTENLSALARIERRTQSRSELAPVHPRPVDPRRVVDEAIAELDLGPDVMVTSEAGARVWMDPADLRLVLTNLLDNAVRYGGAPIGVAILPQGSLVRLKVFDQGPGVPEPFAAQLFQPFTQASEGLQRTARGMGIGLAVVHSLVVANDGQVLYHPLEEGGACFTIALPAAHPVDVGGQAARAV